MEFYDIFAPAPPPLYETPHDLAERLVMLVGEDQAFRLITQFSRRTKLWFGVPRSNTLQLDVQFMILQYLEDDDILAMSWVCRAWRDVIPDLLRRWTPIFSLDPELPFFVEYCAGMIVAPIPNGVLRPNDARTPIVNNWYGNLWVRIMKPLQIALILKGEEHPRWQRYPAFSAVHLKFPRDSHDPYQVWSIVAKDMNGKLQSGHLVVHRIARSGSLYLRQKIEGTYPNMLQMAKHCPYCGAQQSVKKRGGTCKYCARPRATLAQAYAGWIIYPK